MHAKVDIHVNLLYTSYNITVAHPLFFIRVFLLANGKKKRTQKRKREKRGTGKRIQKGV